MATTALFSHHKLTRLMRLLKLPKPFCIGYLEMLTHFCGDSRLDGDLTGMTDEEIEDAVEWQGEPGEFVQAMIACRFIDRDEDGTRIHDWAEWCPRYVKIKLSRRRSEDSPPNKPDTPPKGKKSTKKNEPPSENGERTASAQRAHTERTVGAQEAHMCAPSGAERSGAERSSDPVAVVSSFPVVPPLPENENLKLPDRRDWRPGVLPNDASAFAARLANVFGIKPESPEFRRQFRPWACVWQRILRIIDPDEREQKLRDVLELAQRKAADPGLANPVAAWQRQLEDLDLPHYRERRIG